MKEEVWLRAPEGALQAKVDLPSSKSVSNRVLLIRALCREPFRIAEVSEADDTRILQELIQNQPAFADCGAGGTTFRFLLALRCLQGIGGRISGSPRLVERPVRPLVETLQQLGAGIRYLKKEGFPPLLLSGGKMLGGSISIRADVSSQFVSALLLIAPRLSGGLRLQLSGKVVSSKYIDMTLALMRYFGVNSNVRDHTIEVPEAEYRSRDFTVPSDWSAAAFFYAMAALKPGSALTLPGLAEDVFQGDRALEVLMEDWGVSTERQGAEVLIRSRGIPERSFSYDFNDTPDLAQAFAV
ncbi:MAG: 3-phosphoshikimate 1-carboxyvinyltransferase, partial [Bacteroidia bacterium]|nr:3-phosphoshikimate 1-carboxyvinyltransferase [Bacteroidia bacterium]